MAEPEDKPGGTQQPGESTPPAPARPSSSPSEAFTSQDIFLGVGIPSSDDTPTIITRGSGLPIRPDEALAGVLRGRQLAHFELLEPIGMGGMAAVIRARDTQLDRSVALKILPPDMATDSEIVRRFHQEARAAAKLDHENIARVFYCGEAQGLHFIAFEFVEGENLRALLERRGRIPVRESLGYMLQIATGLAHAAARGVVHRDIKPSNIIIGFNGRAKLVDMGLARSQEPHPDGDLTQSGVTLGTFDYISPEQALEPREADVRSDIYSLGCTFYHMLTGQAPVPEGTAAKKLHHHQHVAPLDPRQLNPEIPDEVAALLARMMAKEPGDRYQRPEELVQHLFVLAQKLGAVSEVPEGLLFLDAPLPGQPRTRPVMMAVLAVLGLVALIAFLGPGPSTSNRQAPISADTVTAENHVDAGPSQKNATAIQPQKILEAATTVEQTDTEPFRPKTAGEFAEYLKNNRNARVELSADIRLTRDALLVFDGDTLDISAVKPTDIRGKSGSAVRLPTIRLDFDPDAHPDSWVALQVRRGKVRIHGVRFEVDAHDAPDVPDVSMTAVERRGGEVTLEDCEFVQSSLRPPPKDVARLSEGSHLSSITVGGAAPTGDEPALKLTNCYFPGGQNAVTALGAVSVEVRQCAFGPHSMTLFDLRADNKRRSNGEAKREAKVVLSNCSAFVTGRSAFRVGDEAPCLLQVRYCVFSHPERPGADAEAAVLIEQPAGANSLWSYTGLDNRYHNLDALWQRGRASAADLAAFRNLGAEDEKSLELSWSPWAEADPLKALQNRDPGRAFRLMTDRVELRRENDGKHVVGVEQCVWGPTYPSPILDSGPAELFARQEDKIVDPSFKGFRRNTFISLREALEKVKPGDVILIKHDGLLKVDPVQLEKAGTDVTIKPYPNSHPVLTIAPTTEPDTAMFKIHDGQLRLERLEFRLAPDKGYRAQAIVMVMGDGQCAFKDCLATLEEANQVVLTLVTLADPSAVMKMAPQLNQQQDPRISLENCLVRGTGNLMAVRASRSFSLNAQDCLVALAGSFLVIDGNPKESMSTASAEVFLNQVTTYLTDHLILLRALKEEGKRRKGLGHTQVKSAAGCLFVSATGSKSLVHLDGVDTEYQMRTFLSWGPDSKHNAYSNFTRYLDQETSPGGPMAPAPYGEQQWLTFSHDDGPPRFEPRIKFNSPPAPEFPLSRVVAADFKTKPEANLQGYGATIDRLPKPADENTSSSLPVRSSDD